MHWYIGTVVQQPEQALFNIICILRPESDRYEAQKSNNSHFENMGLVLYWIVAKTQSGKSWKNDRHIM